MTMADFFVVWIDKMTRGKTGFVTQSFTEANSKNGTEHEGSTYLVGIAGGAKNDTIFLTGDLPVILKGRIISFSGIGVAAYIFESPSYTGGVPTNYQNASSINPVAGMAEILVGATVLTDGNTIFAPSYLIGNSSNNGRGSTGSIAGGERILKPNTAYLLRLASLDTGSQNIASFLSWYEGELDLPVR